MFFVKMGGLNKRASYGVCSSLGPVDKKMLEILSLHDGASYLTKPTLDNQAPLVKGTCPSACRCLPVASFSMPHQYASPPRAPVSQDTVCS